MTPGGEPGVAHPAHALVHRDLLAHAHADGGQVVVRGDYAVSGHRAVIHLDLDAVAACPSRLHDGASRCRTDGSTAGSGEVQSGVEFPDVPDGVETHTEAGCLSPLQRHREQGSGAGLGSGRSHRRNGCRGHDGGHCQDGGVLTRGLFRDPGALRCCQALASLSGEEHFRISGERGEAGCCGTHGECLRRLSDRCHGHSREIVGRCPERDDEADGQHGRHGRDERPDPLRLHWTPYITVGANLCCHATIMQPYSGMTRQRPSHIRDTPVQQWWA